MKERKSPQFAGTRFLPLLIAIAGLLCSAAFLAGSGLPARGQDSPEPEPISNDPYLVKDIVTYTQSSGFIDFVSVNSQLYFSVDDGEHEYELWKSDGTVTGTLLVKDIAPVGSAWPMQLTNVNQVLYFVAQDGEHGFELWKSDGTDAGTLMIKDLNPGIETGINPYYPGELLEYQDVLYFTGNDGIQGYELWKSDGTAEGTVLVKDICPVEYAGEPCSSVPMMFTEVSGILFFYASSAQGVELWKSDGTESGTVLVDDNSPYYFSQILSMVESAGLLYFTAVDPLDGCELWKSDGTEVGTVLVKDIDPTDSSCPSSLTSHGGTLYFTAYDEVHGHELWKSDGTEAGTQIVKVIVPGQSEAVLYSLLSMEDALYFAAYSVYGSKLWKSDGTSEGTQFIIVLPYFIDDLTAFMGDIFFSASNGVHGKELWKSDGTEAGTEMVKDILTVDMPFGVNDPWPSNLMVAGEELFFTASDGFHGVELWVSDGSEPGTTLVKDINTVTVNAPFAASVSMGERLYFTIDWGYDAHAELWKSDGTQAGTAMVKDFYPGGLSESSGLKTLDGVLYFGAYDAIPNMELWRSDGTEEGTRMVKDIYPGGSSNPTGLAVFNNELYFGADDGIHGAELWKSDGTESGTVLVKDINPVIGSSASNPTEVNGVLYFAADDGIHGAELWRSDGTEEGTALVKDIYPGWISSGPASITDLNGTLIFIANDLDHGIELWRSDGTEAGTELIKDIIPEDEFYTIPSDLTPIRDSVYFTARDTEHGTELWKTDGTEAGTVLVKDIFPGFREYDGLPWSSNPQDLTQANGTLFFFADGGGQWNSLWKSDGTEEGTMMVKNIGRTMQENAGPTSIGGVLFLAAADGEHGDELWKSDGTEVGTVMVKDVNPQAGPDPGSSSPNWLTDVNGTLFFFADDGEHGRELWAHPFITSRVYMPMLAFP